MEKEELGKCKDVLQEMIDMRIENNIRKIDDVFERCGKDSFLISSEREAWENIKKFVKAVK